MKLPKIILGTWLAVTCMSFYQPVQAQVEFQSGHFRTSDGVKLHYLETGTGPMLVLVPGWTMPADIWQHQIRHFASKYRVVALDPRFRCGDSQ